MEGGQGRRVVTGLCLPDLPLPPTVWLRQAFHFPEPQFLPDKVGKIKPAPRDVGSLQVTHRMNTMISVVFFCT